MAHTSLLFVIGLLLVSSVVATHPYIGIQVNNNMGTDVELTGPGQTVCIYDTTFNFVTQSNTVSNIYYADPDGHILNGCSTAPSSFQATLVFTSNTTEFARLYFYKDLGHSWQSPTCGNLNGYNLCSQVTFPILSQGCRSSGDQCFTIMLTASSGRPRLQIRNTIIDNTIAASDKTPFICYGGVDSNDASYTYPYFLGTTGTGSLYLASWNFMYCSDPLCGHILGPYCNEVLTVINGLNDGDTVNIVAQSLTTFGQSFTNHPVSYNYTITRYSGQAVTLAQLHKVVPIGLTGHLPTPAEKRRAIRPLLKQVGIIP